jgi:SAM-dependent methyltransferase
MTLIDDFNEEMYLLANPDVGEALRKGLLSSARVHYEKYGKAEIAKGLRRPLVNRTTLAYQYLSGSGIEIGALHNPLKVPATANVKYVDRMKRDELYQQYPELRSYDLVDVDIVDNGEDLTTFAVTSQDFIIANHFIEHCENPIKTIKNFIRVLKSGGILYLAVPEAKANFDKERPITTLKHVLDDDQYGPELSRSQHFLEWAQYVDAFNGILHKDLQSMRDRAATLDQQNYSIHYHVWDRLHFEQLINHLKNRLGFRVEFIEQIEDEIVAIIKKN